MVKVVEESQQMETFALFEQVKQDIYDGWVRLNGYYTKNLMDSAEGYEPKLEMKFKACLVSFYTTISTKVDYPKAKKFKKIHELSKYRANVDSLKYEKALRYFFLMGELMEVIGITKIGTVKYGHKKAPFEPLKRM